MDGRPAGVAVTAGSRTTPQDGPCARKMYPRDMTIAAPTMSRVIATITSGFWGHHHGDGPRLLPGSIARGLDFDPLGCVVAKFRTFSASSLMLER